MVTDIKNYDITDFLRMMDAAKLEKELKEQVEGQIDFDKIRSDIRARLMSAADASKQPLTEAEADKAIDSYQSGLYEFSEPVKGTKLAEMYIDRKNVFWKRVVPGSVVIASLGAIVGATVLYRNTADVRNENKIEIAVEQAYGVSQEIKEQIGKFKSVKIRKSLRDNLDSIVSSSESNLRGVEPFFGKYCSKGTAKDDITPANYEEANAQLGAVKSKLQAAKVNLDESQNIIDLDSNLTKAGATLDSIISEIRSSKTPRPFIDRAESLYQAGRANIENNMYNEVFSIQKEMQKLKTEVSQFAALPDKIDRKYQEIKHIAKQTNALTLANDLYNEAQGYLQTVNTDGLKSIDRKFEILYSNLNTVYSIKIVSRQGVKSGFHRTYRSSGKKWYVVVEAIDDKGQILPQMIRNQETDLKSTVKLWAEEVPESVYESVKSDKQKDGVIDNNLFANKFRGYLSPNVEYKGVPAIKGQITEWEK